MTPMQRFSSDPISIEEAEMGDSLPEIARLVLTIGRMLLEWGADARVVHDAIASVALALGCDSAEAYCQHAAIIVMLRRGGEACSQMVKVGEHGVNLRRIQNLQRLMVRITQRELNCTEAQAEMDQIPISTKHYPVWMICLATGIACAAFGRLLNADWSSFIPITMGAAAGQWIRHLLLIRKHNIFLTTGIVSFISSSLAMFGARLAGSPHLQLAMIASVLLLIPGIPVLNAQIDVLQGKPNLAAARVLRIIFLLLFMALGLTLAQNIFL